MRLLLIEDDDLILNSLKTQMEREGHEVIGASDGGKGLAFFRATTFDAVVTDILMPNVEGLETIRSIRELDPKTIVIAISGGFIGRHTAENNQAHTLLDMAIKMGATSAIQKPFTGSELLTLIKECVPAQN